MSLFAGSWLAEGFNPGSDRFRIAWARSGKELVAIHNSSSHPYEMLTNLLVLSFIHSLVHSFFTALTALPFFS